MNGENPFEKRLERLPQRRVPADWRQEILSAARTAAPPQVAAISGNSLMAKLNAVVTALLWPHPRAWAGLAAVWALVFGLSIATREPVHADFAQQPMRTSPEMRELLRQQERLLAELVEPNGSSEQGAPKPAAPRSQGLRREEFVNT